MIRIEQLHAGVKDGVDVLKGVDLHVPAGQVHAIMGPNGSGKSTLANVLMGNEGYVVSSGDIFFSGQSILSMSTDQRALEGLFMAFQYPVSIPGITLLSFLQTVINFQRKKKGLGLWDAYEVIQNAENACKKVGLDRSFLSRSMNEGFSGGEKKRVEVLQMLLLKPRFIIMDETDSGLDIDSLKRVADTVNILRSDERSFLIVTHYKRILDHVKPDCVHVFKAGKIAYSGGMEVADQLEKDGYKHSSLKEG